MRLSACDVISSNVLGFCERDRERWVGAPEGYNSMVGSGLSFSKALVRSGGPFLFSYT